MIIKTIKFQKASPCTYILTPRLRTCRVVDLRLPIMSSMPHLHAARYILGEVGSGVREIFLDVISKRTSA